jgi:hypothetical protein
MQTVCPDLPWTSVLLFSASQIARITSMSHQPLAASCFSEDSFLHP